MDKPEAAKLVAVIIASCPQQSGRLDGKRVESMIDAFSSLLSDMTYAECNAAVSIILQTSPYLPAVADIRGKVLELKHGPVAAGGEAWGSVLSAMKKEGSYRTPGVEFRFRDPVTAHCVQLMGWKDMCLSENVVADRARFIQLYDSLAVQERKEQQAPMLGAAREAREERQIGAGTIALRLVPGGES